MKKVWLVTLFAFLLVLGTACGKEEAGSPDKSKKETGTAEEEQGVEVDKGLLNVEITLPKDFLGEDIDATIEEAKKDGVKEVTQNSDGSLTYKMSKFDYKKFMKEMDDNTIEYIEEIKNSDDFASIQDVTYNKSFSEFTMTVDQEAFENSFDGFAAMGLGMTGLINQVFAGTKADDAKVTIHYKNADTSEIFETVVYPDDLQEGES